MCIPDVRYVVIITKEIFVLIAEDVREDEKRKNTEET